MKALIVYGGWGGHEPDKVAEILAGKLRENEVEAELSDTLDSFLDTDKLRQLDLIVPEWTMGTIEKAQLKGLLAAVKDPARSANAGSMKAE